MKKRIIRIVSAALAALMLLAAAGCSDSTPKPGEYVFDYDMDSFIADYNDYLRVIVSNGKDEETAQALYDTIKLTPERFSSVEDDKLPYDVADYTDSSGLLASMYCFRNAEKDRYNEIAVWTPYTNYSGNINAYFMFTVLSAAGACCAARVDKNDHDMIVKANEMIGDVCSTVKTSGSNSSLVKFGDACFYASFSNVLDGTEPRVFFYMVPAGNTKGYVDYDKFASTIDTNIDDDEAVETIG